MSYVELIPMQLSLLLERALQRHNMKTEDKWSRDGNKNGEEGEQGANYSDV